MLDVPMLVLLLLELKETGGGGMMLLVTIDSECDPADVDGELIGDWPETITGQWTGGGGEEAAIGLRKVITQPMLKY